MSSIVESLKDKMLNDGKLVLFEGKDCFVDEKQISLTSEQLDSIYQLALENNMRIKMQAIMGSSDISNFEDVFIEDRSEMYKQDGVDEDDAYAQAEADSDDLDGESDTYVEYFLDDINSKYHYEYKIDKITDNYSIVFSVDDSVKGLLSGKSFTDSEEPLIHNEDVIVKVTLYK